MNDALNRVSALAIIPARGGSKGIPGKNIKPLVGKPLLAYSIEQARAANSVQRVVVSTDSDAIAEVAVRYGAEVIRRPPEISDGLSSSELALLHVLDTLQASEGYVPEIVVFLQATSPCRIPGDIDNAVSLLLERKADSLLSCCLEHFTGHFQMREDGSVFPTNFDPGKRPMRQQVPIDYVENGSIYVFRTDILRTLGSRLGGRITVYPMPAWRSFQIDEPGDYEVAEIMMKGLPRSPLSPSELATVKLLVTDFDGVLTDNRVWVAENGLESVACCRSDGLRLRELAQAGVECLVLSSETNPVVEARCRKLGLGCRQGLQDKRAALLEEVARRGLNVRETAYLGNDINDLACMSEVGIPVAVADAYPEVAAGARWVTRTPGGYGALREVVDALVAARTENGHVRKVT